MLNALRQYYAAGRDAHAHNNVFVACLTAVLTKIPFFVYSFALVDALTHARPG